MSVCPIQSIYRDNIGAIHEPALSERVIRGWQARHDAPAGNETGQPRRVSRVWSNDVCPRLNRSDFKIMRQEINAEGNSSPSV